jgi:hypothetical protein
MVANSACQLERLIDDGALDFGAVGESRTYRVGERGGGKAVLVDKALSDEVGRATGVDEGLGERSARPTEG